MERLDESVDLVILDARMPGMDGFELAQRMRRDPRYFDLPMVMVTGLDSKEDRLHTTDAGVNDFIAKPFAVTELQLRSSWLLRMKEAADALKRHRAELEQAVDARMLRGSPSEVLQLGEVIALTHHERWDGSGYPRGLAGEEIPLAGRICPVVDVFDALSNERPYREALAPETVYGMLLADRGRHFDPHILDLFLASGEEVELIQRELAPASG